MLTDNSTGKEIRLGIIGAGSMGKGLLFQSHVTPGVRCAAICDVRVERCMEALQEFGLNYEIADSPKALQDAVRRRVIAVCISASWVAECEGIDVIVEASNAVGSAAPHAFLAIEQGKHLILMNSELDLMFGPLLQRKARRRGVVCTSCDGDQYGVLKNLIDETRSWGFELVMAGNIKGYLDRYATPDTLVAEAEKRNLDTRMCTSYTDGTKLNIEMAILANAFDLRPARAGMLGPRAAHVNEVFERFDFAALRASGRPVVDYILGAEPGGGVFAVGYCAAPYQRAMLAYYKMGDGPFYLFQRPYHLCHIEAMKAVFMAVRQGEAFMAPEAGLRTNVFAHAKRDLPAGTVLDGIGGYDCYGLIEAVESHHLPQALPIGLAEGVVLKRAVPRDGRIALSDVDVNANRPDFQLYARARAVQPEGARITDVPA